MQLLLPSIATLSPSSVEKLLVPALPVSNPSRSYPFRILPSYFSLSLSLSFSAFSRLVVYFALFGVGGSAPPAKFNTMGWFTYRFKHLAYSSFECSYFAGFLPLRFLQVKQLSRQVSKLSLTEWCHSHPASYFLKLQHDYLYFDNLRCGVVVCYLFVNSFVMLLAHMLATSFDELCLHAHLLGCWRLISNPPAKTNGVTKQEKYVPHGISLIS